MVSYSVVSDTELQVNKPMTSSLWTRIRDNPIAIFEGLGWAVTASVYISPEQTIVAASTFTVNHGLTAFSPTNGVFQVFLVCQTAEWGYSIGDVVPTNAAGDVAGSNTGTSIVISATQISVRIGSGGTYVNNQTSGAANIATAANWRMVVTLRG